MPLTSLEIIGHGRVLARTDGRNSARLATELELPVEHGLWIAAKAQAGTAQAAHTTPIYVTVNGGSFVNRDALDARLQAADSYLREIEAEVATPGTNLDAQASRHRAQLAREIAEARMVIEERTRAR